MVVFTCGYCGESVQKPKVEKHYMTICRNRSPNLSCMDCFKDFVGDDYEAHIKCITEEERYSGKGFVSKEKKGEKKQNTWVEMLQSVLDEQKNAPRNVLRIIENITKHNNTPRKKPKFINFVKNVCGAKTNLKDIEQAWDLISVKLSALSNANNRNQNQNKSVTEDDKPQNETVEEKKEESAENGKDNDAEEQNGVQENGHQENGHQKNGNEEQNGETEVVNKKKMSKKQRKEEKKHKKYEAELQSAAAPVPEEEEENTEGKKGKKKKNKTESINGDDQTQSEGKNSKNKKRKRQDTVNSINGHQESPENTAEPVEVVVPTSGKTQKKKIKTEEEEEADESICLHDQNVAKIGELAVSSDKFNWHAVIISLLEKKGNELPFKRLQKKVLGEYSEATGREVDDRIADKFIKKLRSAPNVRVDKNRVCLID